MKSVFITGAARGIGLAIARVFAEKGWRVGLYDKNDEACHELLNTPPFAGNSVAGHIDVTQTASVRAALEAFMAASGGRLDVLVNNAGVVAVGEFGDSDPEQLAEVIAVNVRGLTMVSRLAFPYLKATPDAMVINLCSASSVHGVPWLSVYSASKFYVDGLSQALDIEWAEHDIHVTSLKPPAINTAMGHQLEARHTAKMPIKMEAAEVAEAAFDAVIERRPHHLLGRGVRLWSVLDGLLPARWGRRLTAYLVGAS